MGGSALGWCDLLAEVSPPSSLEEIGEGLLNGTNAAVTTVPGSAAEAYMAGSVLQ